MSVSPLSTGEGRIPLNREGGATGNQTLLSSRTKRKRNHARRQVTRSPDREPCPRTLRTSPPSCGGVAPGERLSFRPIAFASSETAEYRDAVGDRHRTPGVPSPRGLWLCGPAAPDPPPGDRTPLGAGPRSAHAPAHRPAASAARGVRVLSARGSCRTGCWIWRSTRVYRWPRSRCWSSCCGRLPWSWTRLLPVSTAACSSECWKAFADCDRGAVATVTAVVQAVPDRPCLRNGRRQRSSGTRWGQQVFPRPGPRPGTARHPAGCRQGR